MRFVLARLRAPLQSWGTQSAHRDRGTERFPTKSGVIGLVANALGRSREDTIDDLASLTMAAGEVVPGRIAYDFQTVGGGYDWWKHMITHKDIVAAQEKIQKSTIMRRKSYLEDADFLVALSGNDELVGEIAEALENPARPIFLGRKAFLPTTPVFDSIVEGSDILEIMKAWRDRGDTRYQVARVLVEVPYAQAEGRTYDQPMANFATRTYGVRGVVLHNIHRRVA